MVMTVIYVSDPTVSHNRENVTDLMQTGHGELWKIKRIEAQ
jgi:hypothetical protein